MARFRFFPLLLIAVVTASGLRAGTAPRLPFDLLAGFNYQSAADSASGTASEIPASIKKYDGNEVVVVGFMVPTKLEGTSVKEFLLVRSPMMCCYGVVPQVNEWILVTMDKAVPYVPDVPRAVKGVLHVGEQYENGYLTGLYRVDGVTMGDDVP